MNSKVVYYPYIEVPQNDWFKRVLLYWDKLYPIIPFDYNIQLSDYMHNLLEYELIEPLYPSECQDIPHFGEAFLNYVDDVNYPVSRGAIRLANEKTLNLHIQKLDSIGDELVKRGLAYESKNGWYAVESHTANQFMAYMAGTLGIKKGLTPITDTVQSLDSFAPLRKSTGGTDLDLDRMRTKILNVLPVPNGEINVEEISAFKDDHPKELIKFRNEIERTLHKASVIQDEVRRNEFIDIFIVDSTSKIDDLSELIKSRGWHNVSYGSLIAFTGASLVLGGSILSGGLLVAAGSAFGAGVAGYEVFRAYKGNSINMESFVTYAVLAQQQL